MSESPRRRGVYPPCRDHGHAPRRPTAVRGIASRRSTRSSRSCSRKPTRCSRRSTSTITGRCARSSATSCSRRCFLAQLESEAGHFTIADSLTDIADKLVRRHPHVFARDDGEPPIDSAERVRTRWEEIKAQERGGSPKPKTLLSGIAPALPALLRAYQIGVRAASVGFDWRSVRDVVDKIQEEVDELREVVEPRGHRPRARRGRDGRSALLDRASVAPARDRARDRAAKGQRQVHEALHDDGADSRDVRQRP